MAARKSFLLRLDPETFEALQRWANDDLRSINGQVAFLLRRALQESGRLKGPAGRGTGTRARAGGGDRSRSTPRRNPDLSG